MSTVAKQTYFIKNIQVSHKPGDVTRMVRLTLSEFSFKNDKPLTEIELQCFATEEERFDKMFRQGKQLTISFSEVLED